MLQNRAWRVAAYANARARWVVYNTVDRVRGPPARLTCRVCEHEGPTSSFRELRAKCIFGGGTLVRYVCPACGVIFGTLRMLSMTDEALAREYRDVYRIWNEGPTTALEVEAFTHLSPVRGRKYLNYGAGRWSKAVSQLRAQGYDIVGFDRYTPGGEHVLSDEAALRALRFDGIITNSVLEHLVDPVREMRFLRSLLRSPDSCIAHSTPCFRYEIEYTRFHLFFFTGTSADVLARRAGMRVEHSPNPDVKKFFPVEG